MFKKANIKSYFLKIFSETKCFCRKFMKMKNFSLIRNMQFIYLAFILLYLPKYYVLLVAEKRKTFLEHIVWLIKKMEEQRFLRIYEGLQLTLPKKKWVNQFLHVGAPGRRLKAGNNIGSNYKSSL